MVDRGGDCGELYAPPIAAGHSFIMVALVNAVAFFTAVVLGTKLKLAILATPPITAAKRLFGVPDFRHYAIADGIREACARSPRRAAPATKPGPQLSLGFP